MENKMRDYYDETVCLRRAKADSHEIERFMTQDYDEQEDEPKDLNDEYLIEELNQQYDMEMDEEDDEI